MGESLAAGLRVCGGIREALLKASVGCWPQDKLGETEVL
jgi:hypothetical protein